MAFLRLQDVEGFGHHLGVILKERDRDALESLQTLGSIVKGSKLPTSGLARLLHSRWLSPEFVEGNKPLGGHVLEIGTLALGGRQPVKPNRRLFLRIAVVAGSLALHHLVKALS